MQCSFEEKIINPDGSFRHSKCVSRAEILLTGDLCYGLCYRCAYQKLQAEAKRLKENLIEYGRHRREIVTIRKCEKAIYDQRRHTYRGPLGKAGMKSAERCLRRKRKRLERKLKERN